MMPEDALERLAAHDAILMGAVGDPSVPDHVSLWGLILELRQRLDLWANLRPARLLDGDPVPARRPRAGRRRHALRPREHRGRVRGRRRAGAPRAAGRGRRSRRASSRARASSGCCATRSSCAAARRGVLTSATKSNASRFGYVLWDEVAEEVAARASRRRATSACSSTRWRRAWCATPEQPRRRRRLEPLRATSSPTSPRRSRAGWAWPRARTSRPAPTRRRSSSRCTARRRTSPARASPTRPARSGAPSLMLEHLGEAEAAAALMARARGRLPRRAADARRRRHGDDARGRRRGRRARSAGAQRTTPISAPPATIEHARERRAASRSPRRRPSSERREHDRPERLRRVQRRDDR